MRGQCCTVASVSGRCCQPLASLATSGCRVLIDSDPAWLTPFHSTPRPLLQLQNLDLAMALAKRGNLPGAEGLVVQQFQRLYAAGQYKEAAELAADSPQVRSAAGGAASQP